MYLAYDTALRRECVIKRLHLSPRRSDPVPLLRYFEHEALLLASLNTPGHPTIPEIYEYLPVEHCLVMKYIAGQSLRALLNSRTEPLAEAVALRLVRDVCSALAYMHGKEPEPVLHLDVKPDNILIGGDGRVWLVDFGLARGALPGERAERCAGTPGFAPPEQWRGEAEQRSDIYALALTLYALLTNYIPRGLALHALITDSLPSLPPIVQLNPTVRPEVIRLVAWGGAPAVAERPTARQFLAAIEALLAQPESPSPPEPAGPPTISALIGREADLAAYAERLRSGGLVVLYGMAGIGKTALAATLAAEVGAAEKLFWHSFHAGDGADRLAWALAGFLWWNGQPELWALIHQARAAGSHLRPEILLEAQGELAALLSDSEAAQRHYGAALALLEARPAGAESLGRQARACRGMGEALQYEAPSEALTWLERGLDLLGAAHPDEAGSLQIRRASVLIGAGDYDAALVALDQSLSLLPASAAEARADALTNMGAAFCARGDGAAGLARYHEALELYAGLGSVWKQLSLRQNLGIEQVIAGDWDNGEVSLTHALQEAERLGSIVRQVDLALSLGILHTRRGDLDSAHGRLHASVSLAREYNLNEQLVAGLSSLADLQLRMGRQDEAAHTLEEAEHLAHTLAAHDQLPEIHRIWSALLLDRGEATAALERAACAVAAAQELGLDLEHGTALRSRGEALAALGRTEAAGADFAASVELLDARDPYEAALTRLAWGRSLQARTERDLADALLHEAAATLERLGVKGWT